MQELRFPFQTLAPEKLVSTSFQVSFEDARKPGFDVAINTSALYQSLSEFASVANDQRTGMKKINDSLNQSLTKIMRDMHKQDTACDQLSRKIQSVSADFESKYDANFRKTEELAIKLQQRLKERDNSEKLQKDIGFMKQVIEKQTMDIHSLHETVGQLNSRQPCQCDTRINELEHKLNMLELHEDQARGKEKPREKTLTEWEWNLNDAVKLMDGLSIQGAGRGDELSEVLARCEKIEALTKRLTSGAVSLLARKAPDVEPLRLDACFSAWRTYTRNENMGPMLKELQRSFARTSLEHIFRAWKARPRILHRLAERAQEAERRSRRRVESDALSRLRGNADRKSMADYVRRLIPSKPVECGSNIRAKNEQDLSTSWLIPIQQLAKTLSEVAQRMNTFEKALCGMQEKDPQASEHNPIEDDDTEKIKEVKEDLMKVDARITQVDSRFSEFVYRVEDKLMSLREVLTHSFDSIKEFTIRQGPACLSCGQVLSSTGNMTTPPPGFDAELISTSPDVMSVAFCHNLLALLISAFGGRYSRPIGMVPPDERNVVAFDPNWRQCTPNTTDTESTRSSWKGSTSNRFSKASCFRPNTAPSSEVSARSKSSERRVYVGQIPSDERNGSYGERTGSKDSTERERHRANRMVDRPEGPVKSGVTRITISQMRQRRPSTAGPQRPSNTNGAGRQVKAKVISLFATPRIVRPRRAMED